MCLGESRDVGSVWQSGELVSRISEIPVLHSLRRALWVLVLQWLIFRY